MYMNERMDEGDIIFQEKVEIGEYETTGELWERLKIAGAELLVKTLQEIEKGTAPRTPQGKYFTLAPMLKKEMAKIDFSKTATQIKNKVCGLNPIMGAYGIYQGKKIKFWKIQILNDDQANMIGQKNNLEAKIAGEVILSNDKIGLYIKAGSGIIKPTEVQGENAKRMNICDFLRGNKIEEGTKFG